MKISLISLQCLLERGVCRKQFSLAMSSIKTPDDVVSLFESQGVTVSTSAIDPCLMSHSSLIY